MIQRTSFISGWPLNVARSFFQVPCSFSWSSADGAAVVDCSEADCSAESGAPAATGALWVQPLETRTVASNRTIQMRIIMLLLDLCVAAGSRPGKKGTYLSYPT